MLSRKERNVPKNDLTPDRLFGEFRKDKLDFGWLYGYKAMDEFKDLKDKVPFLEPTIKFVRQKKEDRVKAWGNSILEHIGGKEAYDFLVQMLKTAKTRQEKRKYLFTHFFALKAITNLANSPNEKDVLLVSVCVK